MTPPPPASPSPPTPSSPRAPCRRARARRSSGIVAAGAALAVGELIAAFVTGAPSPIAAVGCGRDRLRAAGLQGRRGRAVRHQRQARASSSSSRSPCSPSARGSGSSPGRRLSFAMVGIVALVGVGLLAMLRLPEARARRRRSSPPRSRRSSGSRCSRCCSRPRRGDGRRPRPPPTGRRPFLARALGLGALAVVGGGIGRAMVEGRASQVAGRGHGDPAAGPAGLRARRPKSRSTSPGSRRSSSPTATSTGSTPRS